MKGQECTYDGQFGWWWWWGGGGQRRTSTLSNEKLFVAKRADDECERLERMWEKVKHCQLCVDDVVEVRSEGKDRQRRQCADHV